MMNIDIPYADEFKTPISFNNQQLLTSYARNKTHLCISGPRSSGKTSSIWAYVLEWCISVENFSVLIGRKEYSSIIRTLLGTLEKHILKYGLMDNRNPFRVVGGRDRSSLIRFPNGSEILFMGLTDEDKLKGLEPSLFWLNEGTRLKTSRAITIVSGSQVGGRSGAWFRNDKPFRQIIIDTNPDSKKNWLYQMFHDEESGSKRSEWLDFGLIDNPAFSDDGKQLNARGSQAYEELLEDHPPGHERDRMVHGKWVHAEGAVFTQFDENRHVKPMRRDDFGIDTEWRIICDWGNTTAIGLMATHDGKSRVFKEYYKKDNSVTKVMAYFDYWFREYNLRRSDIYKLITDVDVGNSTLLKEDGYSPVVADKTVSIPEGIQIIQKAFANDELLINLHALDHPDPKLKGTYNSLVSELPAVHYRPEEEQSGQPRDNKPDPDCVDHATDWLRYGMVDAVGTQKLPGFLL